MTLDVRRSLAFSEVPVIDISSAVAGDTDPTIIESMRDACIDVGFFYVSNHGVPSDVVEQLHSEAARYFARPMYEKERCVVNDQMRGYLPLFFRSFEGEVDAGTSHQEGFWIGYEHPPSSARPLDGPNQWPENAESLRHAMDDYLAATKALALGLIGAFEQALNVASGSLGELFDRPTTRLKLNHYPPQENPTSEDDIGVIPHTDAGAFTILWQDDSGGLEIQNKDGAWVGAPPIDNSFVVNLGNLMPTWTNGLFASTPHRVINRGGDRYSIPLFVNPNQDAHICCLTEKSSSDSGFLYGEYQRNHWRRAFPIANIP